MVSPCTHRNSGGFSAGSNTGIKRGWRAKFDLHAKPRYSLIRKRDWRSGSALRSHRRGHWFEPSITHQRTPVSRNGGFIMPTGSNTGNSPPQRTQPPENEVPRDNTRTRRSHRLRTHVLPQTRRRAPRPLHHHRHRTARQRPQRLARVHGSQSRPRRPTRLPRHRIPRPQIRHHPRRSQRLRTIPRRSCCPRRPRPQLRRSSRPTHHGTRTQPR